MNLNDSRILLTGAGSGIGRSLALQLGKKGANLALFGRNVAKLNEIAFEIRAHGGKASAFVFDMTDSSGQDGIVQEVIQSMGGIDILINNAGIAGFCEFSNQNPDDIERLIRTNITGPILLTRAVLPHLVRKNSGRIVNVGSTFGSIGFGHFSVYSATKFAMRGFSESLRRELDHTGVGVTYVAPRATRTALNEDAVVELNRRTGIAMDDADDVAGWIIEAIEAEAKDYYIGWPEKFFARLNGIFPRLVDNALKKNNRIARGLVKHAN
ncbi:MAG: SDR family oxidoreductase [Burkholderiales bacterium]|nr:SDR family oxidoreductase [Burkholderiales bacterium]